MSDHEISPDAEKRVSKRLNSLDFTRFSPRSKKIPPERQFAGARLCSLNVKWHFDTAELLAEKGMYGPARSHLILAAEESMKAMTLTSNLFGGRNIIEDVGMMFHHEGRLLLASTFSILIGIVEVLREKVHTPGMTKQKLEHWMKQYMGNLKAGRSRTLAFVEWWGEAGRMRNSGFYIDFQRNRWTSPSHIGKSSYLIAKKRTDFFIKAAISLKDLSPKDFTKFRKEALGDQK